MSDLNLENIVGFKAVDKDGNERQVTVDEMTELVSARIVIRCIRNYQHLLPLRQPEHDEFEDQLAASAGHLLLAP